MGWLRLVGSFKLKVSFAKEPYKRDYILQKRPIILKSLLIVATPKHYLLEMHTVQYLRQSFFWGLVQLEKRMRRCKIHWRKPKVTRKTGVFGYVVCAILYSTCDK